MVNAQSRWKPPANTRGYTNAELWELYEKALQLYDSGITNIADIARQLGLDYNRTRLWIRGKWQPRKFKPLNILSEGEIGFIAGLIEGEGHISLLRNNRGNILTRVMISNNNKSLIMKAQKIIGGETKIAHKLLSRKNPRWHDNYNLTLYVREQIVQLLTNLMPYLISKKERAKLMIKHCNLRLHEMSHRAPYAEESYAIVSKMGDANASLGRITHERKEVIQTKWSTIRP